MSGGRNAQLERFWRVLSLLESSRYGLSVKELHERLRNFNIDVTDRSVRRDIDALRATGIEILEDEGNVDEHGGQRFKVNSQHKIKDYLVLNPRELLSLFLVRGILKPLSNTPFYQDLEALFKRIESYLGDKEFQYLDEISSEIQFEPGPRWALGGVSADTMDTLRACCTEKQIVEVDYSSANRDGERSKRRLGPMFLYFKQGALYFVAKDLGDGKTKSFAVPRIHEATMTDEPYEGEVVDPEEHFKDSFGIFRGDAQVENVEIQFAAKIAPYVRERGWHRSQEFVNKANGELLMKLEVALTPDLIQWVMGFGPDARVLKPKKLVDTILERGRSLVKEYEKLKEAS
ncbi:MAG: transcriptional regulator [Bdellovibrionales bacterium]|nr:transcriptional regulator [Bdellovibrionales bacterium]